MSTPTELAERVLVHYYESRHEQTPHVQALELLTHGMASTRPHLPRDLINEADRVLAASVFDVDDLAENHLAIRLLIEPLYDYDAKAGAAVYGLARPGAHAITICERAEAYVPLYRTTVMHEVAHVLLHASTHSRTAAYAPSSNRRPWFEREADEFMHSSILPAPILALGIVWVAALHDMFVGDALHGANSRRGRSQWKERYFPRLVSRLCVSRHLIAIKLRRLGVFSEDTLAYHQTYAMPNRWLSSTRRTTLQLALKRIEQTLLV